MYYILVGSGSEQPKPLAEGETKSVQTHCTLDKETLIDAMDIGNNMPGTYAYINCGCVYPIFFSVSFICQGGYGCHGKQSGECGVCCSGHCHWLNDHYPQRYQRHNEDDAADHDATISASSRPCSTIAAPPSPTTFTLFFLPNPIIYYIPLPPNSQTRFHGHVSPSQPGPSYTNTMSGPFPLNRSSPNMSYPQRSYRNRSYRNSSTSAPSLPNHHTVN